MSDEFYGFGDKDFDTTAIEWLKEHYAEFVVSRRGDGTLNYALTEPVLTEMLDAYADHRESVRVEAETPEVALTRNVFAKVLAEGGEQEFFDRIMCGNDAVTIDHQSGELVYIDPMGLKVAGEAEPVADGRAAAKMLEWASEIYFNNPEMEDKGYIMLDPEFGWKPFDPLATDANGNHEHEWNQEYYETPVEAYLALCEVEDE